MAANSKIEWTERTWNPTVGCDRVSPGCDSCYAIRMAARQQRYPAYEGTTGWVNGRLDWTGRVNAVPDRLADPVSWRKPAMVFVDSMSDLFHDDVPDEFVAKVFAVMASTPRHTYQLLTKRHARMRSLLSQHAFWTAVGAASIDDHGVWPPAEEVSLDAHALPNVWLGVSVEDQKWADIRVPTLLDTPAAVRWVSAEPLLGPVNLGDWLLSTLPGDDRIGMAPLHGVPAIDWVVAGGESGPSARPMHPQWARDLRDQCQAAGVPYFFKQWGEHLPYAPDDWSEDAGGSEAVNLNGTPTWVAGDDDRLTNHGRNLADGWAFAHRVGKKAAGRLLDGREWSEYPAEALAHGAPAAAGEEQR